MYDVSDVKNVQIDFTTFNNLTLGTSTDKKVAVFCQNCTEINVPKVIKKNGVLYLSVPKLKEEPNTHQNKFRAGQPLYPDYEINVPKNFSVIISYDTGNFTIRNFKGDLNLSLYFGKIAINSFKGKVAIQSHSGTIDCTLVSGKINVENSKGQIISKLSSKKLSKSTNSLQGTFKNDNNTLFIKTVNAKVTLKPIKTQ